MKKNLIKAAILGLAIIGGTWMMSSCSDDDNEIKDVPEQFTEALKSKFPTASGVKWERDGIYTKADFNHGSHEVEVWFTDMAKWAMTETDYGRSMANVAQPVADAFTASNYSDWKVDGVELYERTDRDFYVIEVESSIGREVDLYYAPDGQLIKTADGAIDFDIRPDTLI